MDNAQPERDSGGDRHSVESVSYKTLTVKILHAENQRHFSNLIYRGCFVTVSLPTASTKTFRTKTVYNFKNPVWNEEVTYRLPDNVKHVLEIQMYAVSFLRTILLSTIWLDSHFTGNPMSKPGAEKKSQLDLRIKWSDGDEAGVVGYHSNGIVVAAPLADLDVNLEKPLQRRNVKDKLLNINGSYQESQTLRLKEPQKLRFYINRNLETDLEVQERRKSLRKVLRWYLRPVKWTVRGVLFITVVVWILLKCVLMCPALALWRFLINLFRGQYSLAGFWNGFKYVVFLRFLGPPVRMSLTVVVSLIRLGYKLWKEPNYWVLVKHIGAMLWHSVKSLAKRDESDTHVTKTLASIQLDPLSGNQKEKVSLKIGKDMVDLDLETNEREEEELDVRMEFDIPHEEKEFLKKRKVVVAQSLQKLLGLECPLKPDQVPTIAVVASGGGARAMTGLLGGLKGLQDMGVLDTVSYITGVSGSTWTMSSLYRDPNWSKQNLEKVINEEKVQMTKKLSSAFSEEKTKYYVEQMEEKRKAGYLQSFSDLSGLIIEHLIFGKETTYKLSDQKEAVAEGQNPLPIYTAVNKKEDVMEGEQRSESEWCEFTPYEVGLLKYGAFVRTEDFGSHFFLGHRIKKLPELRIPYLIGMWSSAFSLSVSELLDFVIGPRSKSSKSEDDSEGTSTVQARRAVLQRRVTIPLSGISFGNKGLIVKRSVSKMTAFVHRLFCKRPLVTEIYNYMHGVFMHKNYDKDPRFLAWKESQALGLSKERHPDSYPNELTPSDSTLQLVDAGLAINIGCAPILRTERKADLIIVLSYSWDIDPLAVVKLTSSYCKSHEIPFPNVDGTLPEQEAYVFKDEDQAEAPIVIHFPLVNVTFRDVLAPGLKRKTPKERKADRLYGDNYTTRNLVYDKKHFEFLINLTYYNIISNKEMMLNVLKDAVHRKMEKTNAH
ncbi:cytosolic phospholipase A2 zeta-like isoform X3 [Sphaeramia orbicularis]|uniref:cytosolic phospholipase A2 zeta-like isoform X2 n=1 Tax=Sphaeramia orbicularis TaxID=375764 RepID=UPI00117C5CF9|nr:cytosolic phospholipase A2 zeta-like isoform X2 [Sphaeramia orbicularis]XP_030011565.1 cytosolic phospholipase A2 zeta-like isoform X3 [Sphaeramia orbicularis]